MNTLVLDVKNINKSFKKHTAVNDVSFQVFSGENVGAIVETPHLYENLSGLDNIKFFSNLYRNLKALWY